MENLIQGAPVEPPRGMYAARVDDKGRVKMPVDFQRYFEELAEGKFFITSLDRRIGQVYPLSVWRQNEEFFASRKGDPRRSGGWRSTPTTWGAKPSSTGRAGCCFRRKCAVSWGSRTSRSGFTSSGAGRGIERQDLRGAEERSSRRPPRTWWSWSRRGCSEEAISHQPSAISPQLLHEVEGGAGGGAGKSAHHQGQNMHIPVMAEEALALLAIRPEGVYIDATAGLGGHTGMIAQRLTRAS